MSACYSYPNISRIPHYSKSKLYPKIKVYETLVVYRVAPIISCRFSLAMAVAMSSVVEAHALPVLLHYWTSRPFYYGWDCIFHARQTFMFFFMFECLKSKLFNKLDFTCRWSLFQRFTWALLGVAMLGAPRLHLSCTTVTFLIFNCKGTLEFTSTLSKRRFHFIFILKVL